MEKLERMRDRVSNIEEELGRIMKEIIEENEAFIIDSVAHSQLYEQGINKLGVSILDYAPYAEDTVRIKRLKGQPTDRVTLEDTREFKDSFYLEIDDTGFEVKATDGKADKLMRKYGTEIMGLTDENMTELIETYVKPELTSKILEYIDG